MELVMQLTFGLTTLNILLLFALLYVYGLNWLKLRSAFVSGLVLFTIIFLMQNIMSFYFYVTSMPYFVDMVSMHVFVLTLLQTAAFAVLNIISWK